MKAYLLFHRRAADVTGPRLARKLGIDGGSGEPGRQVDVLIRYGSTEPAPEPVERVINSAEAIARAVDKRGSLLVFLENGVEAPCPEDYPSALPAVGRKKRHERGSGFWLCLQEADVKSALRAGADYFIPYIPTRDEYRVHIIDGVVPFMQRKARTHPTKHRLSPWLRNRVTGWRLIRCPQIPEVCWIAARAVKALGLDFGAVDILVSDTNELLVLEVNTSPALRGVQLEDWSQTFERRFLCAE